MTTYRFMHVFGLLDCVTGIRMSVLGNELESYTLRFLYIQ